MSTSQDPRWARIPEEILRDILSYNLILSYSRFTSTSFSARRNGQMTLLETLSKKSRSNGKSLVSSPVNLLLVCKQWLRIGTPLLYEGIVITSARQMIALADALRHLPQLGKYIRRLNAYNGFGKEFLEVVTRTPGLHTLGLTMDVHSGASMKGLVAALPQVNPKCFLLSTRYYPQNKNVAILQEVLEVAIPKWTSLERVILNSGLSPWLTSALRRVASLRYISLDEHYLSYDQEENQQSAYGRGWSGNLKRIAQRNAQFKAVLCRAMDPSLKEKAGKFKVPDYEVILLDELSIAENFTTTLTS